MKIKAIMTALGLIMAPLVAIGEEYPSSPVTILVGFGAGSSGDVAARIIAEELTKSLDSPFVVENMPGAGATIAMRAVAHAAPDGYTLMFASSSYSAAPFLFKQLPYDPYADFTPIAGITNVPLVVAVDSKLPIDSIEGLRAYANETPEGIPYAFGNTVGRLLGADLMSRLELEGIPISYNSVPQASIDVMGGRIPLIFSDVAGIQPLLDSGELRVIAVATEERIQQAPDAQTYSEAGVGELGLFAWGGLVGPADLDPIHVQLLSDTISAILQTATVQERFANMGAVPLDISGEALKQYLDSQFKLWEELSSKAGIEPQ